MNDPLRIEPAEMRELTKKAVSRAGTKQWSVDDLPWTSLRPEELTDTDRSVVRFITFIEDHIPGYLTYFLQAFPVSGEDLAIEDFCFNREYFRFLISWANDEERHASVLTRYQIEAGISDPDKLMWELAEEGRKKFALPYETPIQAFTYTLVQEKATQLFYQGSRPSPPSRCCATCCTGWPGTRHGTSRSTANWSAPTSAGTGWSRRCTTSRTCWAPSECRWPTPSTGTGGGR